MSDEQLRRWLVSGVVQGVFFRESTRREAERLGIVNGHALNTRDGRVDVLAQGAPAQLAKLERWLWQGPAAADVIDVATTEPDGAAPPSFKVGWS